jgi:hypothetical protein
MAQREGDQMSVYPVVVAGKEYAEDGRVVFQPGRDRARDNAWLTLDMGIEGWKLLSLNIIRTDEGVVLDLYVDGEEDHSGPIATTYALAQDDFMKEEEEGQ